MWGRYRIGQREKKSCSAVSKEAEREAGMLEGGGCALWVHIRESLEEVLRKRVQSWAKSLSLSLSKDNSCKGLMPEGFSWRALLATRESACNPEGDLSRAPQHLPWMGIKVHLWSQYKLDLFLSILITEFKNKKQYGNFQTFTKVERIISWTPISPQSPSPNHDPYSDILVYSPHLHFFPSVGVFEIKLKILH